MALSQTIDDAREERIGRHGVTARAFADVLARTGDALAFLRARHADGSLPLLRLPQQTADLVAIEAAAKRLVAGAQDIVFLGTGGSSQGRVRAARQAYSLAASMLGYRATGMTPLPATYTRPSR